MMTKLEMLQKMKQGHGTQFLILFRNGDNYEAYYSDAERISELLGIDTYIADDVPTISITDSNIETILDNGCAIVKFMVMDKDGNYTPIIEEDKILHLYDD